MIVGRLPGAKVRLTNISAVPERPRYVRHYVEDGLDRWEQRDASMLSDGFHASHESLTGVAWSDGRHVTRGEMWLFTEAIINCSDFDLRIGAGW